MRGFFVLGVICAVIAASKACAQVIINENVRFGVSPDPGLGDYRLATSKCVSWDAAACSAAQPSVHFDYENSVIDAGFVSADEGIDLFVVQPNEVFSHNGIELAQFPVVLNLAPPASSPPALVGTGDFYLGVRTGLGYNLPQDRTVYGWIHLRPVNGVLTMVENVMSYNIRGIVIGTSTIVPEPTSVVIALIALVITAVKIRFDRPSS